MAYSYGFGANGPRYGGGYGGFQDYDRNRQIGTAPYGGDGAYGVYSGDRDTYDRGYNGGYGVPYGGGRSNVRSDTYEYSSRPAHVGSYGVGGSYGGSYGSGGRDYEREQRQASMYRVGGGAGVYGGKSSRKYRDTNRSHLKYRNKRDTSTSSSSTSDDDNREGWTDRVADKIKGVFGYGPEGSNKYDNQQYGGNYGKSRSNRYNDTSDRYNTSSSYNKYNTGNYGSYGGGYGGNDIVSLRGRREIQPALNEEQGNKSLLWQVNVRGFDLDDIRVTDAGNNKIEISGHSEDVGQHHRRTKQFTRIVTLPEGSNAKEVKSRVSGNGLLTITVPYTGKGLKDYGTRELQLGQGSTQHALTGRSGTTGSNTTGTGSYGSGNTQGGQYQQQQHATTTSTTRTSTNNA